MNAVLRLEVYVLEVVGTALYEDEHCIKVGKVIYLLEIHYIKTNVVLTLVEWSYIKIIVVFKLVSVIYVLLVSARALYKDECSIKVGTSDICIGSWW